MINPDANEVLDLLGAQVGELSRDLAVARGTVAAQARHIAAQDRELQALRDAADDEA